MPVFFHTSRPRDPSFSVNLLDDLAINHTLRHSKSEAVLSERPKTSSGVTSRKFSRPILQPLNPLPQTFTAMPAREPVSLTARNTIYDDGMSIGVALGSPSEARPPSMFGSLGSLKPATKVAEPKEKEPEEKVPQQEVKRQESNEMAEPVVKSKGKRWRAVSGLFSRKKAANVAAPLDRISEDTAPPPETPKKVSEDKPRHSLYLKRSRKSRAPSPPPSSKEAATNNPDNLVIPTPGEARAYEANDPYQSPQLDIKIPGSDFGRYSAMFSSVGAEPKQPRQSLLARRSGVESLTIISPGLDYAPRAFAAESSESSPNEQPARQTAVNPPPRTFSLVPHPSHSRLSAVPAPLLSQTSRPPLKQSQSAIGLQTVKSLQAASSNQSMSTADHSSIESKQNPSTCPPTPRLAFSSDSGSRHAEEDGSISSNRVSTASTNSNFPPSPTSSTYSPYYPLDTAPPPAPPSPSEFRFPAKSPALTAPPLSSEPSIHQEVQYLTIPTPTSVSVPGSAGLSGGVIPFPSPLPGGTTPSPRLKYGYDAPHSPMLAVARTVTVTVRAGQGKPQRPQFVVRGEREWAVPRRAEEGLRIEVGA